jgi:lipoprotein NlpD
VADRTHLVVRGDTLYGIAFRHGLDYRDLARWNAIAPPYTIFPGQRLRLDAARATSASRTPASSATVRTSPAAAHAAAPATPTAASTAPASTPAAAPAPKPVAAAPAAPAASPQSGGSVAWRWPTNGQVIGKFVAGEPTKQGINIAGSSGQPVIAAAAGEVVYSGSGLIGYGELVIIRHSDTFLSAYGHNRRRLVAEGDRVAAGQQVAEMGRSGASRDMLHFEIRRNGKPVDPLPLLPPR